MKGVSDNNAQNNKQIKGNKENLKKPLQVLHISKKETVQQKEELENVELEFKSGLNVLTGETGAGKSILMDCIGFLFGRKNVKIEVRGRKYVGEITGVFVLKENREFRQVLNELGYEWKDEIILRRQLYSDNKRKSFFNRS